jgi:nucleotide-binding universal stress UspA family protein
MIPLGTILHPTDFSDNATFAFRVARALAWDYKARLVLLHVIPPPLVLYTEAPLAVETWTTSEDIKEKLERLAARCVPIPVEVRVLEGDPADMIRRAAEETHSDVIVMGTHGRTALSRLFLGSVAESVLRKAPCPVLTVKPRTSRKKFASASKAKSEAGVAAGAPAE